MARQPPQRRWSAKVTETSDSLDLEEGTLPWRTCSRHNRAKILQYKGTRLGTALIHQTVEFDR